MAKYQVIEDVASQDGATRMLRVVLSPDETTFLKFASDADAEIIDATVDVFLLNRQFEEARRKLDELTKK